MKDTEKRRIVVRRVILAMVVLAVGLVAAYGLHGDELRSSGVASALWFAIGGLSMFLGRYTEDFLGHGYIPTYLGFIFGWGSIAIGIFELFQ